MIHQNSRSFVLESQEQPITNDEKIIIHSRISIGKAQAYYCKILYPRQLIFYLIVSTFPLFIISSSLISNFPRKSLIKRKTTPSSTFKVPSTG